MNPNGGRHGPNARTVWEAQKTAASTKVAVLCISQQQQLPTMPPTRNGQPLFANRGMFDVLGADIAVAEEEEEEEVQEEP